MKKIILTILPLLLIVGCSKKEPLNFELLEKTNGLYFLKSTNEIYSGPVVLLYDDGKKNMEGTFKDGKEDGLLTGWYENGQKQTEKTYKNGEANGLSTLWYENGQKDWEGTYKDGNLISEKCWDEDGNERVCN